MRGNNRLGRREGQAIPSPDQRKFSEQGLGDSQEESAQTLVWFLQLGS